MRERVLVLGLGLDALIVAWVLRQNPNFRVALVGSGVVGHDDIVPPFVLHTRAFARFLLALDVDKSSFIPADGIILRDEVRAWPDALEGMSSAQGQRVQADYLRKLTRQPVGIAAAFPTLAELQPRRLRFSPEDLRDALVRDAELIRDDIVALYPRIARGRYAHPFDRIVITHPPWAAPRAYFDMPEAVAARRHVLFVQTNERSLRRWDLVRAPYTPGSSAVRAQPYDSGFLVEVTGRFDPGRAQLDAEWFFEGARVRHVWGDRAAVPLFFDSPAMPPNVAVLGLLAEPGAFGETQTLDGVFDGAYRLLKRWAHARPRRRVKV